MKSDTYCDLHDVITCHKDVRSNTTVATPAGSRTGPGAAYWLHGHKWFTSAPMSDAFLTLAQV